MGGRYKLPRAPYQHHPSTPKEAALRYIIAERYKNVERTTTVEDMPSIFGFPAFVDDLKSVAFRKDGSLSVHLMIPPSFVDEFYRYSPFICGNPMAVTMEIIQVTVDDLDKMDNDA